MESIRAPRRRIALQSVEWSRGVTLIELMVVLAIILILSMVVITSHASFNKTILLSSTAYDVALTIRSAQTYGLGTRVTDISTYENSGQGIHFDKGTPTTFTLFADQDTPTTDPVNCHPSREVGAPDQVPGDCIYDAPGEQLQVYTLGNGMRITAFQTQTDGGSWTGYQYGTIVFARPNTRAYFSGNGKYRKDAIKARITITSPQDTVSYVCVGRTGEIRVVSSYTAC